ncbi:hypothetical protein [Agromyces sp. SYSU T00266]|uniref:hypothetical protein n=1 Tax=Agromyces zhanjiangensis TaxID=3158562 RepID=UPI003396591D
MTGKRKTTEPTEAPANEDAPQQGFNAFLTVIELDGDARAPRMTEGWEAIKEVLSDREVHPLEDLVTAASGLAENSVRKLLRSAIDAGKVVVVYNERKGRRTTTGRAPREYRLAK